MLDLSEHLHLHVLGALTFVFYMPAELAREIRLVEVGGAMAASPTSPDDFNSLRQSSAWKIKGKCSVKQTKNVSNLNY